jgi:hypothetical protein
MTDSLRAAATIQLLAYEEQGIPAVWYEDSECSSYAGACARRKMLDPSFGIPIADGTYDAGYPRVEPLTEALKLHHNFYCYGCNAATYTPGILLHHIRDHLLCYEIPLPEAAE